MALPGNVAVRFPVTELTPIRVRGKKRKLGTTAVAALDAHSLLIHREQLLRSHNHDARHSRASSQSSAKSGTSKRSKTTRKGPGIVQKKYSRLERLPVELIEQIFVESLEFNLARASSYLGKVLSSESIYRGLILLAFWNDPAPDNDEADAIIQSKFRPFHYVPMDLLERQALQWSVLSCRWCTRERVRDLMRDMIKLSMYRWMCSATDAPWDAEEGRVTSETDFEDMVDAVAHSNGAQLYHFRSVQDTNCTFPIDDFDFSFLRCVNVYPTQSPLTTLAIPSKLVRGSPWTDSKLHFLQFLRKYITILPPGTDLDFWSTFASRTTIQDGIHSAILDRHPRALRALLELDDSCHHIHAGKYDSFHPYRIPAEYFPLASRQGTHAVPLLRLLVRAAPLSIPHDDAELTEWAIESESRGEVFGGWLVKFMRDVPVIMKRGNDMVFREGSAEASCPMYGWEFEQVFGVRRRPWTLELWQDVYQDFED